MPYNIPILRKMVDWGFHVIVVHDTGNKLTPYQPPKLEGVEFYTKDSFNQHSLNDFALQLKPELVYLNGRTTVIYNRTSMMLRRKFNTPVVMGSDTQWIGGKQWVNVLTSWFRHKLYASHMLVAGFRQFEGAKRLGFTNDKVSWPLYSADTDLFLSQKLTVEKFSVARNFLFVGRFAKVKGLDYLLNAWSKIERKNGATLTLVGNGPLKNEFQYPADVLVKDFSNQNDLLEIADRSSCFVLASIFEPWALVIHEFAAAGLPLIVTNSCGASDHFVMNNYNGFVVNPKSAEELAEAMQKIIDADANTLFEYGKRSRELSTSITPDIATAALLSPLKRPY